MTDPVQGLAREIEPPAAIRGALVEQMRREGLLRHAARSWQRPLAAAALLVIGFGLGYGVGRPAAGSSSSPRFAFLLYGTASDPAHDAVRVYSTWARGLAAEGRTISGEKLGGPSVAVGGSEPAGQLGGFFLIDAADLDDARRLAERHPHVRRGGVIVVRRIDPTP